MKSLLITIFLAVLLLCGMLLHAANGIKIKLFKAQKLKEARITEIKKEIDFLPNILVFQ
jgi:succinate dehydrogenase/fumarate reductase cytochrome b subunit